MEDNQIIEMLNQKLKDYDMWYATKNDPTWESASHYYKLDEYGDLTDASVKQVVKEIDSFIGDGAVSIDDAIEVFILDALRDNRIAYTSCLVTEFKDKPVVDNIEAYENPVQLAESKKQAKVEGYKRRIQEENNKSANLISQMFQADDFDSDSNQGQIVMRTSELFNALSDRGYDVQVSFDNGESQSAILLGQQGGQVIITITDADQPLNAFVNGNFEVNDDTIQVLSDIKEQISAI